MCKVFVEYTVSEEMRTNYLQYMQILIDKTGLMLYEGTDQPGLFIEIWSNLNYSAFLDLKRERLNPKDESIWKPLIPFVTGGVEKIHIWHFSKVEGKGHSL
jgi:hypothetical protein